MKAKLALAFSLSCVAVAAYPVPFENWAEQRFPRLPANEWTLSASEMGVASDASVSLIWTRLPATDGTAMRASWNWSVTESVPPTSLTQKGGDDRNLALYFVFMPAKQAEASRNASIRKMLKTRDARVLMYVWGGDHTRGEILPSPYLGKRGKTVIRRAAGTGRHTESVDLKADFQRAFGGEKSVLVGMAVSSDSDDTGSSVRARLGGIRLE